MKLKEGVSLANAKEEIRPILIHADRIWKEFGQELVVTEYMGGVHSPGSHHYYGYALDLRTRYFGSREVVEQVAAKLRSQLGGNYFVLVHSTHIHVHFRRWR